MVLDKSKKEGNMPNTQEMIDKLTEARRLVKARPCDTSLDGTIEGLMSDVETALNKILENEGAQKDAA